MGTSVDTLVVLVLVFAVGGGLLLALAATPQRGPLDKLGPIARLEPDAGEPPRGIGGSLDKYLGEARQRVQTFDSRIPRGGVTERQLADAKVPLLPHEWFLCVMAAGLVFGLLLWLRLGAPLVIPIGFPIMHIGGRLFLSFRIRRRHIAFDRQLSDFLLLLGNAIKAGNSFAQAMQAVALDTVSPVREELERYNAEIGLGVPHETALSNMLERNDSIDLALAINAVQIHRETGGNLSEVLELIAETIRERVKVSGEIRTLTAQARLSGYLISGLPVILSLFLSLVAPEYFTPMLHNPVGLGLLGLGGFGILMGGAIMRSIVRIDV